MRNINRRNIFNDADDLLGIPEPTFWGKWFGGLAAPVFIAIRGVVAISRERIVIPNRRGDMTLQGEEAIWFGIAMIFFGIFLHFHYFWNSFLRLQAAAHICKLLAFFGAIDSLGYVFWLVLKILV